MSSVTFEGFPPNPARVEAIIYEEAERALRQATAKAHAEVLARASRHRRTGHLMRSVTHRVQRLGNMLIGVVGTNVFYAPYLEYGTGLYGPRNRWIVPVRARFLVFPEPGNAGFTLAGRQRAGRAGAGARMVYARRVRGIRPLRIFRDAALVSRPFSERYFKAAQMRSIERIAALLRRNAP